MGVYAIRSALRPGTALGGERHLALAKAWHHLGGLGVHIAEAISSLPPHMMRTWCWRSIPGGEEHLALAKAAQHLAGLSVPQLDHLVIAAAQELAPVVAEGYVLYTLHAEGFYSRSAALHLHFKTLRFGMR